MISRLFIIVVLFFGLMPVSVAADEIRPAYLQLTELSSSTWGVLWKVPSKGIRRLALNVQFPQNCEGSNHGTRIVNGAYIQRWRLKCSAPLQGENIQITGLADTRTDVLVHVVRLEGGEQTNRLTPANAGFTIKSPDSLLEVAATYLFLGFEHILSGFDHLLFVLALLFMVGSWRRLVGTITAFTVAHSITLAVASLGWVTLPQAPVEALIALSIVFVAVGILRKRQGHKDIAQRWPWVIAFMFGLLHGFGFAGALGEIGLPQHAIPVALLFFNVGVELGQLAFVAGVFAVVYVATLVAGHVQYKTNSWQALDAAAFPAAYMIGAVAMFWVIERTYNFII